MVKRRREMTDEQFVERAGARFEQYVTEWSYLGNWAIPTERVIAFYRCMATADTLFDLWEEDPTKSPYVAKTRRLYHGRMHVLQLRDIAPGSFLRLAIQALNAAMDFANGDRRRDES